MHTSTCPSTASTPTPHELGSAPDQTLCGAPEQPVQDDAGISESEKHEALSATIHGLVVSHQLAVLSGDTEEWNRIQSQVSEHCAGAREAGLSPQDSPAVNDVISRARLEGHNDKKLRELALWAEPNKQLLKSITRKSNYKALTAQLLGNQTLKFKGMQHEYEALQGREKEQFGRLLRLRSPEIRLRAACDLLPTADLSTITALIGPLSAKQISMAESSGHPLSNELRAQGRLPALNQAHLLRLVQNDPNSQFGLNLRLEQWPDAVAAVRELAAQGSLIVQWPRSTGRRDKTHELLSSWLIALLHDEQTWQEALKLSDEHLAALYGIHVALKLSGGARQGYESGLKRLGITQPLLTLR